MSSVLLVYAVLSNTDPAFNHMGRLNERAVQDDLRRRKSQRKRRHVHLSDEAADIADLKDQVASLQGQVGQILRLVGGDPDGEGESSGDPAVAGEGEGEEDAMVRAAASPYFEPPSACAVQNHGC